ncbi:hypothetical protein EUGRSUZ_C03180 [Eucalyptus grandis]|uniref:Uncharacterized protein n=2 Tax=Eucalyptus grandis TaxID=71139 RepID=A0ACC3LJH3_EUCGR|nr:hypothetical protein EUGRSUZ_C03180 [Eucalyptus grandis]
MSSWHPPLSRRRRSCCPSAVEPRNVKRLLAAARRHTQLGPRRAEPSARDASLLLCRSYSAASHPETTNLCFALRDRLLHVHKQIAPAVFLFARENHD